MPSQKGETVDEIYGRMASFLTAFFARIENASSTTSELESDDPDAGFGRHKNVIFYSHAASSIALVRELVGDRGLPLRMGCCAMSTLVPKAGAKRSKVASEGSASLNDGNALVGQWDMTVKASADFLTGGVERDWGFEDIEVNDGVVINDPGMLGTEGMEEKPEDVGLQVKLLADMAISQAGNSRL